MYLTDYIKKIIVHVLGLAVLGIVLSLSSCGCSGDDSSDALPIFQFRIFNADGSMNLFAFNGMYSEEDLEIFLSDGVTPAFYDDPLSSGTISLEMNPGDAMVDGDKRTNIVFVAFGGESYELRIDYDQTTQGRCDVLELELDAYTFDGTTTVPENKRWGGTIDLFLQ